MGRQTRIAELVAKSWSSEINAILAAPQAGYDHFVFREDFARTGESVVIPAFVEFSTDSDGSGWSAEITLNTSNGSFDGSKAFLRFYVERASSPPPEIVPGAGVRRRNLFCELRRDEPLSVRTEPGNRCRHVASVVRSDAQSPDCSATSGFLKQSRIFAAERMRAPARRRTGSDFQSAD